MLHEFAIVGTPVSLQAKSSRNREKWKGMVADTARHAVPEEDRILDSDISVVLIHFYFDAVDGDLDNIAKPILDGMAGPVYPDDRQVAQLTLRRTDLGIRGLEIQDPPPRLADALQRAYEKRNDFVYVRIDEAPNHSRLP